MPVGTAVELQMNLPARASKAQNIQSIEFYIAGQSAPVSAFAESAGVAALRMDLFLAKNSFHGRHRKYRCNVSSDLGSRTVVLVPNTPDSQVDWLLDVVIPGSFHEWGLAKRRHAVADILVDALSMFGDASPEDLDAARGAIDMNPWTETWTSPRRTFEGLGKGVVQFRVTEHGTAVQVVLERNPSAPRSLDLPAGMRTDLAFLTQFAKSVGLTSG